jgi:hypothetical protein
VDDRMLRPKLFVKAAGDTRRQLPFCSSHHLC